jgi:hypothetical protein
VTTYTPTQIRIIIRAQKRVLWLLLFSILLVVPIFLPVSTALAKILAPILLIAYILIGAIGALFIYRLALAIEDPVPWLYLICAFIPGVSTITLLILNIRATAALTANGIDVGFMGARTPVSLPYAVSQGPDSSLSSKSQEALPTSKETERNFQE